MVAPSIEQVANEDESIVVRLPGVTGSSTVSFVRIVRRPRVGSAVVLAGNSIRYTSAPNFSGVVTIGYEACAGVANCARGTITIVVRPANDAPAAIDDSARTHEGVPITIDVLVNDSDPDGDELEVLAVSDPTVGTARAGARFVRFTPPKHFEGTARFSYTARDGHGGRARAIVHVVVAPGVTSSAPQTRPVPPPASPASASSEAPAATSPTNQAPTAGNDTVSLPEGSTVLLSALSNDIDPDGDTLNLVSLSPAARGVANRVGDRIQYTAPTDYHGPVDLTYEIADSHGARASGKVTITVLSVNGVPSFVGGADEAVAEDSGSHVTVGWASAISAGPSNEAGQSVSFLVGNDQPALFASGGQPAVAANGTLAYTVAANATGTATVTVRAKDDAGTDNGGTDTSPPQTFTITIQPVNDSPNASADTVSLNEDASSGATFNVLANDTDPDGDVLSVLSFDGSGIAGGILSDNGAGSFTYIPDTDSNGTETFAYTTSDGAGGTAVATVTITVLAQPDPPRAGDDAYLTPQDTPFVTPAPGVLGNDGDPDGDAITLQTTPVTNPANGTLVLNVDGSLNYTPNPGFSGADSFTYRIDDGTGLTADGDVTITVSSVATPSTLYLQPSGASPGVLDLAVTPPPAASTFADLGGDGNPGLTIKNSNGDEATSNPAKQLTWAYTLPTSLALNGPVTLQLWSITGNLLSLSRGTLYAYLYDCASGGSSCVRIASNTLARQPWNTSLIDWTYHTMTIGSVTRTIAAGRELRVRLLFQHGDLWVTMTSAYPSSLQVTVG